jgi:hypothetical protein
MSSHRERHRESERERERGDEEREFSEQIKELCERERDGGKLATTSCFY